MASVNTNSNHYYKRIDSIIIVIERKYLLEEHKRVFDQNSYQIKIKGRKSIVYQVYNILKAKELLSYFLKYYTPLNTLLL